MTRVQVVNLASLAHAALFYLAETRAPVA